MPKKGGEVIKNTKDCNAILKECYAQYRIKLFNYCLARLDGAREDADDCVQDSFLVLQQKLNSGEVIDNPRAFLYRTADNCVKRRKAENAKAAKRQVSLEDAESSVTVDFNYLKVKFLNCLLGVSEFFFPFGAFHGDHKALLFDERDSDFKKDIERSDCSSGDDIEMLSHIEILATGIDHEGVREIEFFDDLVEECAFLGGRINKGNDGFWIGDGPDKTRETRSST